MRQSIYWKAIYKDGTSLCQFEEDGKENKYPDIDRYRLAAFEIRKAAAREQPDRLLFKMFMEPGRRLIYRRRVLERMQFGKEKPELIREKRTVVYLVGWQATIEGRNVQDIAYVFGDGHVELAGKWREAPYNAIGSPLPAETKCFDEHHFTVGAVLLKKGKKAVSAGAILVKKETKERM